MSGFRDFLRKYLNDNNMSIYRLSKLVGCSASTISCWINNDKVPAVRIRAALASVMGYTLAEFDVLLASNSVDVKYRTTEFATALSTYIAKNRLTFNELACKIGVQYGDLQGWISSKWLPVPHTVHAIATAIEISDIECAYLIVKSMCVNHGTKMARILCTLRYGLGLNANEISSRVDIAQNTWLSWEMQGTVARQKSAAKLANWLNVSLDYIYEAFDSKDLNAIELYELQQLYMIVKDKRLT